MRATGGGLNRSLVARLVVACGVIAGLLVISFSYPLADWWGDHARIRGRPDTGEWDVHIVVWFATTSIVGWLVRPQRRRHLAVLLVSILMLSVILEWAQPRVTLRTFQWGDILGNLVGISLAGCVLSWLWIVRPGRLRPVGE